MRRRKRIRASRNQAQQTCPPETGRILLDTSDPETKALWETAQRTAAEVAAWPPWKHNEVPSTDRDAEEQRWRAVWGVP